MSDSAYAFGPLNEREHDFTDTDLRRLDRLAMLYGANSNPQPEVNPTMHITLNDGESVVIQRPGRPAVVTVTATGVHNPSGLTVGRRPAATEQVDTSIVRISIGGRAYCYKNPDGAEIGDYVTAVLPNGEPIVRRVLAHDKGDYRGGVYKSCRKAVLPS